jgi:hypothetical protein
VLFGTQETGKVFSQMCRQFFFVVKQLVAECAVGMKEKDESIFIHFTLFEMSV